MRIKPLSAIRVLFVPVLIDAGQAQPQAKQLEHLINRLQRWVAFVGFQCCQGAA